MLKSVKITLKKISPFIFFPLAFYWLFFTFIEYISIHTSLSQSVTNFEYTGLVFVILGILSGFFYIFSNEIDWPNLVYKKVNLRLIWVFLIVFFTSLVIFSYFGFKTELLTASNYLSSILYLSWRLILTILGVSLVGISSFAYGNLFTKLIQFEHNTLSRPLLKIGIGFFLISTMLFTLGLLGMLNLVSVITILLLPLVFEYRAIFEVLKNLLWKKFEIAEIKPKHSLFSLVGLTSASLTLLHTQKPFPLGWDSSTLYLNLSNILASREELLTGYDPYNWSLLTSIGYVFNNPNIAIGITAFGGLLALLALYKFCSNYLNVENSILILTIVGTLPSLVFQSTRDIKNDLPLVFILFLISNLILEAYKNEKFTNFKINWKYFLIIGVLTGFSIGIKLTALFFVFGLFSVLVFRYFKYFGILTYSGILTFLLIQFNLHELFGPTLNSESEAVIKYSGLLLSLVSTILIIFYKQFSFVKLKQLAAVSLIILGGMLLGSGHWFIWNISTVENLNSIQQVIKGRISSPTFNLSRINNQFENKNEQKLGTNINIDQESKSGNIEAVSRYAGYEEDGLRYQTLFYDTIMNTNVKNPMTVIGFLLISVFPLLFTHKLYNKNKLLGTGLLIFLTIFLLVPGYILSAQSPGCLGNITHDCLSTGLMEQFNSTSGIQKTTILPIHYVSLFSISGILALNNLGAITLVISTGTIITLLSLFFLRARDDLKIEIIGMFTTTYLFFWLILGQGIYWYGLLGFLLLFFLMGIYKQFNDETHQNNFFIKTLNLFIAIWIFFAYFNLFTPRNPGTETIFTSSIAGYMIGQTDKSETLGEINSAYVTATEEINQDSEFIYRVGTQIVYFVENNDKRILNDGQLDLFNRIYDSSGSKEQIAEKMSFAGFKYLVVDLNTASIDTTPGQTLTSKFNKLDDFISENEKLKLISTDRVVKIDGNNQNNYDGDEIIRNGSIVVFEIN